MNKLLLLIIFTLTIPQSIYCKSYISKENNIFSDNVRFQVLTPTLIRMEYFPSNTFINVPTVVVKNRNISTNSFDVFEKEGWLYIKTGSLTLKYQKNSGKFTKNNLQISWKDGNTISTWNPGDLDDKNLGGIVYDLGGVRKGNLPKFPNGFLSRNGYHLLDDSDSPIWNKNNQWIEPRTEENAQDWYFFVYNHDYVHTLKEHVMLFGKIPMIPRYTLGAWYSRHWSLSDKELKDIIKRFRTEYIPLDILVIDYTWHDHGWEGYDWNHKLFPHPDEFIQWITNHSIYLTLSTHTNPRLPFPEADSHSDEIRVKLGIALSPEFSQINLTKGWKFSLDPENIGIIKKWCSPEFDDSKWMWMHAAQNWEDNGIADYNGYAWYRKYFEIPAQWERDKFLLVFDGVDDAYELFVNGILVANHGMLSSELNKKILNQNISEDMRQQVRVQMRENSHRFRSSFTDISKYINKDKKNLIAVRVIDWSYKGGICECVYLRNMRIEPIYFNLAEQNHAEVYEEVLLKPKIEQGVDFWWNDGANAKMKGLNPYLWTNRFFYKATNSQSGLRSFQFGRYGGIGNHRYPAFFTGDIHSQWETLRYEIPFTSNAGNVLTAYVTHDIGGYGGDKLPKDLFIRWVQFGVFSPLLRLHSHFGADVTRLPWDYGESALQIIRDFFKLRYRLIPYIYTYCRITHDTGLPILRHLYIQFPELEAAYEYPNEYFFGDDFLVAPITEPGEEVIKEIYLPPGTWIDFFTGDKYSGDSIIKHRCSIDRMPLFVRQGAIIPMQPDMQFTNEKSLDPLTLKVYPGTSSEFNLYEDDGVSKDYKKGVFAWTPVRLLQDKKGIRLFVGPTEGRFYGQKKRRGYIIEIHGSAKPKMVTVNESRIDEIKGEEEYGWYWTENQSITIIKLKPYSIREQLVLEIE